MWQANNRNKQKKRKDVATAKLEMRRVSAEIKAGGAFGQAGFVATSRVVLSDFSPTGVSMFTTHNFQEGSEVSVTIDLPKQFFCRGRVKWCSESATSGAVLAGGDKPFRYRVNIQFVFDSDEERQSIMSYCEELERQNMLVIKRPAA